MSNIEIYGQHEDLINTAIKTYLFETYPDYKEWFFQQLQDEAVSLAVEGEHFALTTELNNGRYLVINTLVGGAKLMEKLLRYHGPYRHSLVFIKVRKSMEFKQPERYRKLMETLNYFGFTGIVSQHPDYKNYHFVKIHPNFPMEGLIGFPNTPPNAQ